MAVSKALVLGVLLTSAATAYAECAWVLWTEMIHFEEGRPTGSTFTTPRAYLAKDECDREAKSEYATQSHAESVLRKQGKRPDWRASYVCFPDTEDPRGPKTK